MATLAQYADHALKIKSQECRLRTLNTVKRNDGIYLYQENKRYVSFSCNDYLGLSQNSALKHAAITATEHHGTGAGASRLVTGNHTLYEQLEHAIAKQKNTESAVIFGSGYLANIGTIPALVGKGDLVIADKLIHACLIDGIKLSGASWYRFTHNNIKKCEELLKKYRDSHNNCLLITDHVFSMDGDIAPIKELVTLTKKYDAWLLSDDAHGFGTISNRNFPDDENHIQMGTLSKALGAYGGYVAANKTVIDYLINNARSLIYSTALPPAVIASAYTALKIINQDPKLCEKPLKNAQYFTKCLNLPLAQSPIVPLILGNEGKTLRASEILKENGYLASAIRPPTVPNNTARLRFTFSALHTKKQIKELANTLLQHQLV